MDSDIGFHGPTTPSRRLKGGYARRYRGPASSRHSKTLAGRRIDLGCASRQRGDVVRDWLDCPQLYGPLFLKVSRGL